MVVQLEQPLEYLEVMGIEGNAARVYFPEYLIMLIGKEENRELKMIM